MERLTQFDTYAIAIDSIYYDDEFNCRGAFTIQSVQDLARSIEENGGYPKGLQFPVVVQPFDKKGFEYRLLAGHRRLTAVKSFLKWDKIPAQVRPNLTEYEARILNFTENLERKDLNILEEARWIANTFPGGSLREIAAKIKRPTRWIHSRQKLVTLPEEIQQTAAAGLLSAANIDKIWALPTRAKQLQAAQQIAAIKRKGAKAHMTHLASELRANFHYRKTKDQMRHMVATMLNMGVEGLAPRALVWAQGELTDDQLIQDIKEQVAIQKQLENVISVCATKSKKPSRK